MLICCLEISHNNYLFVLNSPVFITSVSHIIKQTPGLSGINRNWKNGLARSTKCNLLIFNTSSFPFSQPAEGPKCRHAHNVEPLVCQNALDCTQHKAPPMKGAESITRWCKVEISLVLLLFKKCKLTSHKGTEELDFIKKTHIKICISWVNISYGDGSVFHWADQLWRTCAIF